MNFSGSDRTDALNLPEHMVYRRFRSPIVEFNVESVRTCTIVDVKITYISLRVIPLESVSTIFGLHFISLNDGVR